MHTLRDMADQPSEWLTETNEVGVMLADSCMYQRIYPKDDPMREESLSLRWSSFYGLALPLVKSGLCVRPLQLDNVRRYANYLDDYKTIVLSYEFMKPESPDLHNAIAQWVRGGGKLLIVGDGSDSFHDIREWWNAGDANYHSPAEHLLQTLGLARDCADGVYAVEQGFVGVFGTHPAKIAQEGDVCDAYLARFTAMLNAANVELKPSNKLLLRRGPYVVVGVLDESTDSLCTVSGTYVDLYDDTLSIVSDPSYAPGTVRLLREVGTGAAEILASSGRLSDEEISADALSFTLTGPSQMTAAVRVRLPKSAKIANLKVTAKVDGETIEANVVGEPIGHTALLRFESSPDGVTAKLSW